MTHNVLGKNLLAREQRGFTTYLSKKYHRIEELLHGVPADAVHLHATCEKFATKAAYKVSLELRVEGEQHFVYEDSHSIHEATDLAVDKLIAQLKRRSTKQQGAQRKTRAERRGMKEADALPDSDDEPDHAGVFRELQPLLPNLRTMLERELRKVELSHDLAPGQVSVDAIIDGLAIDIYDRLDQRPEDLPFATWVTQRALYLLRTSVRDIEEENALTVSLNRRSRLEDDDFSEDAFATAEDVFDVDDAAFAERGN